MKAWIFLPILLFTIFSCGQSEDDLPAAPLRGEILGEDEGFPQILPLKWYPNNRWQRTWSRAVIAKVKELELDLHEVNYWNLYEMDCVGYESATLRERRHFWLVVMAAIASQESAFNPRTRYYEVPLREWSEGLLQLSLSNKGHGSECSQLTRKSILEGKSNLECGLRIMKNQLKGGVNRSSRLLFPPRFYYWSTLTTASKKAKVIAFFKKHRSMLSFCEG